MNFYVKVEFNDSRPALEFSWGSDRFANFGACIVAVRDLMEISEEAACDMLLSNPAAVAALKK